MPNQDPIEIDQAKRQAQKEKARALLEEYKTKKLTLQRPVFFVPGWMDESCVC